MTPKKRYKNPETDKAFAAGYSQAMADAAAGAEPLTLADVKKMSEAEINARWDEIQPLLEGQDA